MKRVILKYGLISGGVSTALMYAMLPFVDRIGFDYATILGYTIIVISFLFVYFGIRSYRDTVLDGRIGFLRGVGVGMLITVISSVCYVLAWLVMYYNFMPDFLDRYAAYVLDGLRAKGAAQAEIDAMIQDMALFKQLSSNPFLMAAFTFLEPLPVGIVMTLVSAAVLKRAPPRDGGAHAVSSPAS